ncbi:hypothetical protein DERP_012276 [Dermatophagoides pteronyssinus]|uniref:Uncharacterized protein n=1 Tax=Dermatophagoides pteronyssinus TaxID=6956 RepID=A0ABQ8JG18_DERPT|nr:hypothetical protein DERP_012276 [Dermatophagoides pteronyssinus]
MNETIQKEKLLKQYGGGASLKPIGGADGIAPPPPPQALGSGIGGYIIILGLEAVVVDPTVDLPIIVNGRHRQTKQLTNNVLIEVFGLVKIITSINLIVKPNIALILYLI